MRKKYKKPLSVTEQIEYLSNNKKVVYKDVSIENAKLFLYEHNYINVISPFKRYFFEANKDGNPIRDVSGNHVYENDVDFNEYIKRYNDERAKYPCIYSNLLKFETKFNAIVSYEIILGYDIKDYNSFLIFINDLKTNIDSVFEDKSSVKKGHLKKELEEIKNEIDKFQDIYILMDRLSLSKLILIFQYCNSKLRSKIFKSLMLHDATLGYMTFSTFNDFLLRLPSIRNCICHFNSLEILVNYWNIPNHILRKSTDRKKYLKIIDKLSM